MIEECELDDLDEREIYWISEYNAMKKGYNLSEGGGGCRGYKHSSEELDKMRKAHKTKKVVQLDLNMNYIKTWHSASTAYGYIWRFTDDYIEEQYKKDLKNDLSDLNSYRKKKVNKYSLSGEFIQTYDSLTEAAKQNNLKSVNPIICCGKVSTNLQQDSNGNMHHNKS